MEDKKLETQETLVTEEKQEEIIEETQEETVEEVAEEIVEEEIVEEEVEETEEEQPAPVEEEPTEAEKVSLDLTLSGEDLELLLNALKEYTVFLKDNKRKANSIVIDEGFNLKIDNKIKRTDELRFLIKKEVIIVDSNKEIFVLNDEGEVIGIETFEETQEGRVINQTKPETVGHTSELPEEDVKEEVMTSVQSVSEEL